MKKMKLVINQNHISLNQKLNQVFVKIAICFILLGFAYFFYFSTLFQSSPFIVTDHPPPPPPPPSVVASLTLSTQLPENNTGNHQGSPECDIFTGEWIKDPTGPRYTNSTCKTIEHHQNCVTNGRPDSDYIYWRWKPFNCHLPPFNPTTFLHFMHNKSMAFIGDSIARNHLQSLLCILSQIEEPIEVYHDEEYKSKRWVFGLYNFTLSVVWSPFLLKANVFEDNDGHSSGAIELHLDELDPVWVNEFSNFDYIVVSGGKWFLKTAVYYENNEVIGCHNCNTQNVLQNMTQNMTENLSETGFEYAYRKALCTVLGFITKSSHKVYTFFRTTTPDHFENGEWNTGGYCNRTSPFKNGEVEMRDVDKVMRDIELEEFESAREFVNGSVLRLFDTTRLSLLRPDGHPGPYRGFHPFDGKDGNVKVQNDCLHWCLPGPIDSWNDLMMSLLLDG